MKCVRVNRNVDRIERFFGHRSHITAAGPEAMGISAITLGELRYGAACSARPEANHQAIDGFISGITLIGVDARTAHAFGDLKAQLRKQGMLIEDFDLVIAATARSHDLSLVTNNVDHFGRIPHLRLENWV